jgi:hypothetical protein
MSWGLICACADERHEFDPRSLRGELAIRSRCREYAVDEERSGLCPYCEAEGHAAAPPAERDIQQGGSV